MQGTKTREYRLGWSFLRYRMHADCLRRLYWYYYGSREGGSPDAPRDTANAYQLKYLTTPPILVGNIVHEILGRWLRTHSAGAPFPTDRLLVEVDKAFDFWLRSPRFWHDVYSDGVGSDEISAMRERARWLIGRAADNRYVKRLCNVPRDRFALIDHTLWDDRKVLYRDIELFGMPDVLVYGRQGEAHFIDWKTGRESADLHELQMGAQALFAREKLGLDLGSARAHIVYLDSGEIYEIDNLGEAANKADDLISAFISDMADRLTDVASNVADDIARFPMTENTSKCDYCNFKALCDR